MHPVPINGSMKKSAESNGGSSVERQNGVLSQLKERVNEVEDGDKEEKLSDGRASPLVEPESTADPEQDQHSPDTSDSKSGPGEHSCPEMEVDPELSDDEDSGMLVIADEDDGGGESDSNHSGDEKSGGEVQECDVPKTEGSMKRKAEDAAADVENSAKKLQVSNLCDSDDLSMTSDAVNFPSTLSDIALFKQRVSKDIKVIEEKLRQKEQEWNKLVRLLKLKEELFLKLRRRETVLSLYLSNNKGTAGFEPNVSARKPNKSAEKVQPLVMLPVSQSSTSVSVSPSDVPVFVTQSTAPVSVSQGTASISVSQSNAPPVSSITVNSSNSATWSTGGIVNDTVPVNPESVVATQNLESLNNTIPPEIQAFASGGHGMKRILPKIMNEDEPVRLGRSGVMVDVKSLIAQHKAVHPIGSPRVGKRVRRFKPPPSTPPTKPPASVDPLVPMVVLSQPSSPASTPPVTDSTPQAYRPLSQPSSMDSSKKSVSLSDPNLSFKDVLMQFARMSQQASVKTHQDSVPSSQVSDGNRSPSSCSQTSAVSGGETQEQEPITLATLLAGAIVTKEKKKEGKKTNSSSSYTAPNPHIDTILQQQLSEPDSKSNSENVPNCQCCHKKSAQFVCAGCNNQWYCSRECQVNDWDDHSEVCTG